MNFLTSLTSLTGALLRLSLQASLVIVLVLLVLTVVGKRLSPRVRYALWLLVVLRLALPISLESSVSVFNPARAATATIVRAANSSAAGRSEAVRAAGTKAMQGAEGAQGTGTLPSNAATSPKALSGAPRSAVAAPVAVAVVAPSRPWRWALLLSVGWLAGVGFLLARIIWIPLRLNRRLARQETAPSPAVFEILEQAKHAIGVNQVLPIVQSRAVESPALLGFIRPWLLLPHGLVEKFSAEELRLMFLHELAHLKRRDIAVNWLVTLLQILHWFNPLIWYAFARMRADREEACDELALSFAPAEQNRTYGHAIIKLLEGFSRPPALPGLVGILEDKQHMNRRIMMIAQFKRMIPWSAPAAGLFLVLGMVTLTDAQTGKEATKTRGPSVTVTTKTLISGTGREAYGVLSPNESMVAYIDEDSSQIAVRDLNTDVATVFPGSKTARLGSWMAWSPDSKRIAYQGSDPDGAKPNGLKILSRSDGSLKAVPAVAPNSPPFFPHDWSPDGNFLLGSSQGLVSVLNAQTGHVRALNSAVRQTNFHGRFSADGRWVVYEHRIDGNRDVYISNVENAVTSRITDSPAEDGSPVFSSDGQFIIFSSNRRGTWDLWATRVDQGKPVGSAFPIKYDFGDNGKWTTAKGKLAFRISGSGIDGVYSADMYEIPATRSPAVRAPIAVAKSSFGRNSGAAWSVDGTKVAYGRHLTAETIVLCIQSLADGRENTFEKEVHGMRGFGKIYWSQDGQTLGLSGIGLSKEGRATGAGLYLFSLATQQKLTDEPLVKRRASLREFIGFSRDGSEFIYHDGEGRAAINLTTKAIRRMSSAVEQDSSITPKDGWSAIEWNFSIDERSFAYVSKGGTELIAMEANGGIQRKIAGVEKPSVIQNPSWSPDGTKIAYYVRQLNGKYPRPEVHVVAADGSWEHKIDAGGKYAYNTSFAPGWAPDSSKFIVPLVEDLVTEIGVLENFLPPEKVAQR